MAKRAKKASEKNTTHRVNTVRSNGAPSESAEVAPAPMTVGEAMRRAVEELGEVVIDEQLAAAHLRELAECYEQVTKEQAAYNQKAEVAKTAKKSLESATNLLLEKVRMFTHPEALPLFDQAQAEADRAEMLGGGEVAEANH